jgi:hypothetical protein
MIIPVQTRNETPNPAANEAWLFLDSKNGNLLTIKYGCPACTYMVVTGSSLPSVLGDCDCACEAAKKILDDALCLAKAGTLTGQQYLDLVNGLNVQATSTPDPLTGACTGSVSTNPGLAATIISFENPSCNGLSNGNIQLNITGGEGPYSISYEKGTAGNLPAGNNTVTITDSNGDEVVITFTLTQPNLLVTGVNTVGAAPTANVSVIASGGTLPYAYSWTGPGGFTATTQNIVAPLAGNYACTVTDANGCTSVQNVVVP